MTALGTPLAVFTDVAVCDTYDQHEVALVTDGQRTYVYPLDPRTPVHCDPVVSRTGVTLTAPCPCPGRGAQGDPDPCTGQLVWRLDTDHGWGADGDGLRLLTSYGQAVEA